jgi:hypothetical protein
MNEAPNLAGPHHLKDDGSVSYGLDDGALVEFYPEQVHMEFLSKQIGQPIFQERIFTRIVFPGNRLTVVIHQAKGIDYEMALDEESGEYHTQYTVRDSCENGDPTEPVKYPRAWARFLRKGISADSGLPVEEWGAITRSYAASLKAQNIHTVEALAGLSDAMAQNIMGGIKYRDLAKARLDEAARNRIVAREQERASNAEERMSIQTKQIEALQAEVMRLQQLMHGTPAEGAGRMVGNQQMNAAAMENFNASPGNPIKKMSRKEAQAQHRLPDPEKAA